MHVAACTKRAPQAPGRYLQNPLKLLAVCALGQIGHMTHHNAQHIMIVCPMHRLGSSHLASCQGSKVGLEADEHEVGDVLELDGAVRAVLFRCHIDVGLHLDGVHLPEAAESSQVACHLPSQLLSETE